MLFESKKNTMGLMRQILLAIVGIGLLTGCGKKNKETEWGIFQEPIKSVDLPTAAGVNQISQRWKRTIGNSGEIGYAILRPAANDQGIFVTNRKGAVQRLDSANGKVIWQTNLKKNTFAGVGVGAGLALVALDTGDVVAFDAETGAQKWSVNMGRQISAIPAAGENRVIVRTADGLLLGLNATNGETIWSLQRSVPGLSIHGDSSPLINGDTVITGLSNGKIMANAVDTGRDIWETDLSFVRGTNELERLSDVDSQPMVVNGILYAATYQGDVVSVDLGSSRVSWRNKISTRLPLSVNNGRVYVTDDLGGLSAIGVATGDVLWAQPGFQGRGVSNPVGIGDRVVIGDARGNIHLLDANDGHLLETKKVASGAIISLVPATEGLIAFSVKGGVVALSIDQG